MHNKNDHNIEKAFERYHNGENVESILSDFPEDATELRSLFDIVLSLKSARDRVMLSEESLHRIKANVTQHEEPGYIQKKGESGRFIHNPFIIMNKLKVLLPLGVLAVLVIVFVSMRDVASPSEEGVVSSLTMQESALMSEENVFDIDLLSREELDLELSEIDAILSEESEVDAALANL